MSSINDSNGGMAGTKRRIDSLRPTTTMLYIPPAKRKLLEEQQRQQEEQRRKQQQSEPPEEGQEEPGEETNNGKQKGGGAVSDDTTATQRRTWETQKRVVHGSVNRMNEATLKPILHDLFQKANLVRMRGVLAKSILAAATTGTDRYGPVYASAVAVLNSKLPEVGELVVHRAILHFRRCYRRRDKPGCSAVAIFLGHLLHQNVVHELLLLQILSVLLDGGGANKDPTDDAVEVACELLTVTGQALLGVSPAGVRAILERIRTFLQEGTFSNNRRVEYKMEQLLAARKNGFAGHPSLPSTELDLVEADDQITHEVSLDDTDIVKQDYLDVFRVDPEYAANEEEWGRIRAEILGEDSDSSSDNDGENDTDDGGSEASSSSDGEEEEDDDDNNGGNNGQLVTAGDGDNNQKLMTVVHDLSEQDLVHLRRTLYLTIMSAATFEECAHKLAKIDIPDGREAELVNMIIECCSQERTFLRYYGMVSTRFCLLQERWRQAFQTAFEEQYNTIHRLETNKLRNVAKLFAHLLYTDALPWSTLQVIQLTEDHTTSSSRIFIKILMQEMAQSLGIETLKKRLFGENDNDNNNGSSNGAGSNAVTETTPSWYNGLFPNDFKDARHLRYSINFFTSIGLGPLTDRMRALLKQAPKLILQQQKEQQQLALKQKEEESDASSVVSSSSSSSSSTSSSSSSSLSSSSFSSSSYSSRSSYSSGRQRRRTKIRGQRNRRRRQRSPSLTSSSESETDSRDSQRLRSSSSRRGDRNRRRDRRRSPSYSSSSSSSSRSRSRGSARKSRPVSGPTNSKSNMVDDRGIKRGNDNDRRRGRGSDRRNDRDRDRRRSPSSSSSSRNRSRGSARKSRSSAESTKQRNDSERKQAEQVN